MRRFFKLPESVTELLASRSATSWQFATIFAIIFIALDALGALAGTVVSVYDFPLLSIFNAMCIWLVIVSSGVFIWRKADTKHVAAKNALAWLSASTLSIFFGRVFVWFITGVAIPNISLGELLTWIIGGFVNIAGYAVVVSGVVRYREISNRLRRESNRLESLRQTLTSHLEALKTSYSAEVQQRIAPALAEIRLALSPANPGQVISQARAAIESAVLPLSQQIESESIEVLIGEIPRLSRNSLVARSKHFRNIRLGIGQNFSPLLSALVFVASILPAFGVYYSAAGLLSGLVIVAIILIGQVLFGLLFAKRKFAIMTALMAIFISAASIAIIGAQSIQLFVPNHDADADAFLAFGIFLVVFLITFAQFIYAVSLSFLEKTAETQEQYSNELKKRDSAIRSLQNRVAKVIHADIQAKLRAILLRVKTGGITEGNIGELNQDLEYINSVLASIGDEEAVDFAVELQGLVEFWSGVCDIRLEVEREVVEVLALRPDLSRAALDVLAEGVSNAVKHAEAKSATIALSLTSQSLEISVSNPTSAVKIEALSTGQGGRHLDRVAASWRLESTENSTILLVSLAL